MRPVDQTTFVPDPSSPECGNCMQAAYASLLELPLDLVPHFAAIPGDNGEWWEALCDWLWSQGFSIAQTTEPINGVLGLLSGPSPRGEFSHLVVALGEDIVHDPHPSRAGLVDEGERVWWYLVPVDPAMVGNVFARQVA